MPCVVTLNERALLFYCEPGILTSVLTLLRAKSETLTPTEKLVFLSFDEMCVIKEWCCDQGRDVLYMTHDRVFVVMIWGLVVDGNNQYMLPLIR